MEIPSEKLETCLEVLQQISEDPSVISEHERMKGLIAKIHTQGKRSARRAAREGNHTELQELRGKTAVVESQNANRPFANVSESAPLVGRVLKKPVICYICKALYTDLHFFYHLLCPTCAAFNYGKREQRADLTGRVALVTGGRIKIGYQLALRMLRDGAKVLVTTRFPQDAALRFSSEPDLREWQGRLHIYGVDFRNLPALEAFLSHLLGVEDSLDILINNAAQTIKRPEGFYQNLVEQEQAARKRLPEAMRPLLLQNVSDSSLTTPDTLKCPTPDTRYPIPALPLDADGQPLDVRSSNSWSLKLEEVSSVEMLEVHLINAVAPFMLNSRLKPLLLRSPFVRKFIVNVSAMEGQFNRESKTENHPHTNMAKAALNMMTRTSAVGYARDGIFMNSVDTGWITDENPYTKKVHLRESHGFYTPLDVIDGVARIYDPIVQGIEPSAEPLFGHFLKDYAPCPW